MHRRMYQEAKKTTVKTFLPSKMLDDLFIFNHWILDVLIWTARFKHARMYQEAKKLQWRCFCLAKFWMIFLSNIMQSETNTTSFIASSYPPSRRKEEGGFQLSCGREMCPYTVLPQGTLDPRKHISRVNRCKGSQHVQNKAPELRYNFRVLQQVMLDSRMPISHANCKNTHYSQKQSIRIEMWLYME